MAKAYTSIIENPEETAGWLTGGLTYLIPKTKGTTNPKSEGLLLVFQQCARCSLPLLQKEHVHS